VTDFGPCVDVYALTRRRTRAVIDRFLRSYVDVPASEDRGDEELRMVPLGYDEPLARLQDTDWEWRPAETLTTVIDLMLSEPFRAFTVYPTPRDASLRRTILGCTRDGALVFGVSLPDPEPDTSAAFIERPRSLLTELMRLVDGEWGVIAVEEPPPLDSTEFAAWVPRNRITA
jgi:hypothetical protein